MRIKRQDTPYGRFYFVLNDQDHYLRMDGTFHAEYSFSLTNGTLGCKQKARLYERLSSNGKLSFVLRALEIN